MKLRHQVNPSHPVFGGWIKLSDDDRLEPGDQTVVASTLLTPAGESWVPVLPVWKDQIGMTIREVCDTTGDIDGGERLFRRPRHLAQVPDSALMVAAKRALERYEWTYAKPGKDTLWMDCAWAMADDLRQVIYPKT